MAEEVKLTPERVMTYITTLGDQLKDLTKKEKELKANKKAWEAKLFKMAEADGVKGYTLDKFSCFPKRVELVIIEDADKFFDFVFDNRRVDLIQKRIGKTAALEMMGDIEKNDEGVESRPDPPPPGCGYSSHKEMVVRRK